MVLCCEVKTIFPHPWSQTYRPTCICLHTWECILLPPWPFQFPAQWLNCGERPVLYRIMFQADPVWLTRLRDRITLGYGIQNLLGKSDLAQLYRSWRSKIWKKVLGVIRGVAHQSHIIFQMMLTLHWIEPLTIFSIWGQGMRFHGRCGWLQVVSRASGQKRVRTSWSVNHTCL